MLNMWQRSWWTAFETAEAQRLATLCREVRCSHSDVAMFNKNVYSSLSSFYMLVSVFQSLFSVFLADDKFLIFQAQLSSTAACWEKFTFLDEMKVVGINGKWRMDGWTDGWPIVPWWTLQHQHTDVWFGNSVCHVHNLQTVDCPYSTCMRAE